MGNTQPVKKTRKDGVTQTYHTRNAPKPPPAVTPFKPAAKPAASSPSWRQQVNTAGKGHGKAAKPYTPQKAHEFVTDNLNKIGKTRSPEKTQKLLAEIVAVAERQTGKETQVTLDDAYAYNNNFTPAAASRKLDMSWEETATYCGHWLHKLATTKNNNFELKEPSDTEPLTFRQMRKANLVNSGGFTSPSNNKLIFRDPASGKLYRVVVVSPRGYTGSWFEVENYHTGEQTKIGEKQLDSFQLVGQE